MKTITVQELRDVWQAYYDDPEYIEATVLPFVEKVHKRGDRVLLYVNHDLGHYDIGKPRLASYGSPDALIEQRQFPEPPKTHPDLYNEPPLWRYQLEAEVI